jgi:hypothetical protein
MKNLRELCVRDTSYIHVTRTGITIVKKQLGGSVLIFIPAASIEASVANDGWLMNCMTFQDSRLLAALYNIPAIINMQNMFITSGVSIMLDEQSRDISILRTCITIHR